MKQSNTALKITEETYDQTRKDLRKKVSDDRKNMKLHSLPFNYREASDEALVAIYLDSRSEEACNEIASRYNDLILGFAMKLCRNTHDAEEIKQDVFLILVTKLHTFKGNSKFSTWLYRVTLNTCYKYLNDSKKRINKEVIFDDSFTKEFPTQPLWAKTPDEMMLAQQTREIIVRAVDELNESNKKIFQLKDIKGFSNAEVGESMGLSISAVKSRVLRTRLALKEKISGYF